MTLDLQLDECFRRDYAGIVGSLVRRFGMARLELVEDAVQEAMLAAARTWPQQGVPQRSGAWLQRVAQNRVIDKLRRPDQRHTDGTETAAAPAEGGPEPALSGDLESEQLRMLFVCCDGELPPESRLVLALKILCGFRTEEIARRLFISEANVYKRLERGRERLRRLGASWDTPAPQVLEQRTPAVRQVIYLLFNEGYSSAQSDSMIRRELCDEAIHLASVLSGHPAGDHPQTWALLALMHFHAARFEARTDGAGGMLLLEEQDRSLWDRQRIGVGFRCLANSAQGAVFSRFHAEAAIAAEHCRAPTFSETRWAEVIELYEILERYEPSPLHSLNRAIAVAQLHGPQQGLTILHAIKPPGWLAGYYLWDGVLGELERQAGNHERAKKHLQRALQAAPTTAERQLLGRRLAACR